MKLKSLICRNVKLFFKDKGLFFSTMITPLILILLYITFLGKVYTDSFNSAIPEGFKMSESIVSAMVGGQLLSSILAVCCITVSFCSNLLSVQDKANGTLKDLTVSPVKNSVLSLSYYISTVFSTLIVCFTAFIAGLLYVYAVGWYMNVSDILLLCADIIVLVLFGTALSSIINVFLTTEGQMSAVGTIISAGYGFISGAYMPISQYGDVLQKVLSFLPGTYGTSVLRSHALRGVFEQMASDGVPGEILNQIKASIDCNISFFGNEVSDPAKFIFISASALILMGIYILLNIIKEKKTV